MARSRLGATRVLQALGLRFGGFWGLRVWGFEPVFEALGCKGRLVLAIEGLVRLGFGAWDSEFRLVAAGFGLEWLDQLLKLVSCTVIF